VLDLDAQYRWVLVGEPRREYLWVLARDPQMSQDTLQGVLGRAREMGFPVERIRISAPNAPAR
jgi:apolipoprotein D and lipocalin family protein